MTDLSEAIRILADHVQMPATERTRLNTALGIKAPETEQASEEDKPKAKRKAA